MIDMLQERESLVEIRDELLTQLAALASDATRAKSYLTRIRSLTSAIERTVFEPPPPPGKYARHKSAISAILFYLDGIGNPVSDEQLIKDLCEGGWRGGIEGADVMLKKSIGSYVGKGNGSKTKLIKKINGLVGKGDWPEDMFS